jgi:exonuclease III
VLQLLTWNINRRGADAVARHHALIKGLDVLLLQEVRQADRNALVAALGDLGLAHCSDVEVGRKSYGNLMASKHRLEPLGQLTGGSPFPELLVGARVELAAGGLAIMCVHAPNGSDNSWDKIHVLRALSRAAQQLAGERLVIGGDFNEPR